MRRRSARLPVSLLFPPQISAARVTVDLCFISLRSVVFTSAPRAPASSTDPARLGEEQPDPALLSETGPAAAPGPGDQHGRAGVCVCVLTLLPPRQRTHFEVNNIDLCHQKLVIITLSLLKKKIR